MMQNGDTSAFPSLTYAGLLVRCLAACIDMLICLPLYWAIRTAVGKEHSWLGDMLYAIPVIIIWSIFFSSRYQASPGMHILHFRIGDRAGKRISFLRAFLYQIVGTVLFYACFSWNLYLDMRYDFSKQNILFKECMEPVLRSPATQKTFSQYTSYCSNKAYADADIAYADLMKLLLLSIAAGGALAIAWTLCIALTKEKTGPDNLICGTRYIKGRA